MYRRPVESQRERRIVAGIIALLLGTGIVFRLAHLSSIPGINGDEGWWGVQARAWLAGLPYEAKTTSGNPIDMLFLVPLGLLHAVAKPSFFLLRALPAFSNLFALALGFVLVRRIFGPTTAWIQTIALAIAPTAISHSRFCQDPSQSVLWTSVVLYLCLLGLDGARRSPAYLLAALAAFALAFWTHPTNVFVAPFLVLPLYPILARWYPASRRGRIAFVTGGIALVVVAALVALFVIWPALQRSAGSSVLLDKPWLATAAHRVLAGGQWLEYIGNYGKLFSGVTIYAYFSGPHLHATLYGVVTVIVMVGLGWGVVRLLRRNPTRLDVGLVAGWAAMWLLYFLFAGPESIRPHVERWGLCLLAPFLLVAARALAGWIETAPRHRWVAIGAGTAVAVALLGSFYVNYFRMFETNGGKSHRTFVTAATEPKQQALELILAEHDASEPLLIVAQDWWHYWPIAYLAQNHPQVTVRRTFPGDNDPDLADAVAHGRFYVVEFAGSPELGHATEWLRDRHLTSTERTIKSAGGRDLFSILRVSVAAAAP